MARKFTIALVAHDARKPELVSWVRDHEAQLQPHSLVATGTTGGLIQAACPSLSVRRMNSGPLGGDQQLGAMIAEGRLDMLFFFTDPMTPMPHDVDVKALTRLSVLYDVPMACNKATAEFLITSPHFTEGYERQPAEAAAAELNNGH